MNVSDSLLMLLCFIVGLIATRMLTINYSGLIIYCVVAICLLVAYLFKERK